MSGSLLVSSKATRPLGITFVAIAKRHGCPPIAINALNKLARAANDISTPSTIGRMSTKSRKT